MKNFYLIRLIISWIVFILAILAIYGVAYPVKILDLQFAAILQRVVFDFSYIAIILIALIILLTFLFGRFYCSIICPFGILQEFANLLFRKKNLPQKNLPFKYFIAVLVFGFMMGGSAFLIRYIDPYTIFGSAVSLSVIGIISTLIVLTVVFFKSRYFCTNICPVGAVLGLISKFSLNKIYIDPEKCLSCGLCTKICPSGCINHKEKVVDNEVCVKCLRCLKECRQNAMKFGFEPKKDATFSLKRRELIVLTSAIVVFGSSFKAAFEFGKSFAKKIYDVILPPGAVNANRMANKCLNCNLCVENCSGKILVKSDNSFPAVHIDYSQGKGYCEYNCNKCSEVCPSGAIKRISLSEKQKTRIAMAMIKEEKCTDCGVCVYDCPLGAISKINNKTVIDSQKCIGCGKCAKSCKFDAIKIFAINSQTII